MISRAVRHKKNIYPQFTIQKIEKSEGKLFLIGKLDRTTQGNEKWIDDRCIGSLLKGQKIAFGRWFKKDGTWKFQFDEDEKDKLQLSVGEIVAAIDGYWGERIVLVYDKSIQWESALFKSRDNWDHDHCAICWATISEQENSEHFIGNKSHPVCKECYQKYIKLKNISFIPNA